MRRPTVELVATAVVCSGLALLALRLGRAGSGPWPRRAAIALISLLFLSTWTAIRARARYPIYAETAAGRGAFDAHAAHPAFAMASSLWQLLDGDAKRTLAVVVGRDVTGHNQFFYPLLGSRLQNRLVHVPISAADDGGEIEPGPRYAQADPEGWISRLEAEGVDLVVGLWPATPEREWLAARPEEFDLVAYTDRGVPWTARPRSRGSMAVAESVP